MTWPSPNVPLPTDRLNSTPQFDDHVANHNTTNLTINDDIAPQITQNQTDIATNTAGVATNAANLTEHETSSWLSFTATLDQTNMTPTGPNTATGWYQVRHGMCFAYVDTQLAGTNPTGPAATTMSLNFPAPAMTADGIVAYGQLAHSTDDLPFILKAVNTQAGFLVAMADGATAHPPINNISSATLRVNYSYRTSAADT